MATRKKAKTPKTKTPMIGLEPPGDLKWLAAYGKVNAYSTILDLVMSMTIKVITGVSVEEALLATWRTTGRELRDRVRRLAKDRLGDGPAFIELEAILSLARAVAEDRNDVIHAVFVRDENGDPIIQHPVKGHLPIPTVKELETLAGQIRHVLNVLNYSRLEGPLKVALDKQAKKLGSA